MFQFDLHHKKLTTDNIFVRLICVDQYLKIFPVVLLNTQPLL